MKQVTKDLVTRLKRMGLTVNVGSTYLNVAKADGTNCEFYPCVSFPANIEIFTASYTVDGKLRDLDFELPEDTDQFIETLCKILEFKPIRSKSDV